MKALSAEMIAELGITVNDNGTYNIGEFKDLTADEVIGARQTFSPVGSESLIVKALGESAANQVTWINSTRPEVVMSEDTQRDLSLALSDLNAINTILGN